jgi:hypothetical protein
MTIPEAEADDKSNRAGAFRHRHQTGTNVPAQNLGVVAVQHGWNRSKAPGQAITPVLRSQP